MLRGTSCPNLKVVSSGPSGGSPRRLATIGGARPPWGRRDWSPPWGSPWRKKGADPSIPGRRMDSPLSRWRASSNRLLVGSRSLDYGAPVSIMLRVCVYGQDRWWTAPNGPMAAAPFGCASLAPTRDVFRPAGACPALYRLRPTLSVPSGPCRFGLTSLPLGSLCRRRTGVRGRVLGTGPTGSAGPNHGGPPPGQEMPERKGKCPR